MCQAGCQARPKFGNELKIEANVSLPKGISDFGDITAVERLHGRGDRDVTIEGMRPLPEKQLIATNRRYFATIFQRDMELLLNPCGELS